MTISENLKSIRQIRGLTQEDVAKQIGLTRQTISSYESNRTQPDLETLKVFAEIYDVELSDILYGKSKMQMKRKAIKFVAVLAAVNMMICNLLQSIILWTLNTYFIVENGPINDITRPIMEARFALLNIRNIVEGYSMFSFGICCIVLLALLMTLQRPVPIGTKLKYLAILVISSALTILPWTYFDNIYGFYDYTITAIRNLIFAFIMFGLTFIGEYISKKFRTST